MHICPSFRFNNYQHFAKYALHTHMLVTHTHAFICWMISKETTDSVYQGLNGAACCRIYCLEPTLGTPHLFFFGRVGKIFRNEWH